ncbi:MAG: Mur ligase domain-containing protein [Puniceicoccales bacterium]|jgi:UDP-N-acetylmuramoyl-tripeptide--D-alanyl-D-alanine ligase|nr:Mur ligase domain-containing protein [Puniceicoccales bacterium]
MPEFSSAFLQEHTAGAWHGTTGGATGANLDAAVNGFSIDTRTLRRGECFVALKTEKRDGHDFLADALAAGAAAALVEHPVAGVALPQLVVADTAAALRQLAAAHRDTLRCPVIGITGSAGKTSTKDLLARMLGKPDTGTGGGNVLATVGNLNNTLGVPLTLLRADPKRHRRGVVVECGMSERGEMDVIGTVLRPTIALITNVLPAHLAGVGSLADIAREKAALARHVMSAAGVAIFPAELLEHDCFARLKCLKLAVMFNDAGAPPVFGTDGNLKFWRGHYEAAPKGWLLKIFAGSKPAGSAADSQPGLFPLLNTHSEGMARNAILAIAAATLADSDYFDIATATASWKPSAGRGEWRTTGGRRYYADCYNANPCSVLDAAGNFDRQTQGGAARQGERGAESGEQGDNAGEEGKRAKGEGIRDKGKGQRAESGATPQETTLIPSPLSLIPSAALPPRSPLPAPRSLGSEATNPRIFVLGGMNELGEQSAALHERVGRELPLRAGDILILHGGDAPRIADGVLAAGSAANRATGSATDGGFPKENIIVADTLDAVRAAIDDAPAGAPVFLKASRSFALERLLDPPEA